MKDQVLALDPEWKELLAEAYEIGLSPEEVRLFLETNKEKSSSVSY
ncbi:anti-repressor SinI family protein [Evansella sp. LMS18]|jgi:hypothetical protein|nr:anti-repressor SinI family protein [Evansella sp. LMS18]UTR10549.1 anti-repressor SinI family protein [Evansella sp. LMS18]